MPDQTADKQQRLVEVVEANYRLFFHVAMNVVHNQADAEDAVATAVLRTLGKLGAVEEDKLVAYIAHTAKNVAIDMLKKGGKTKVTALPADISVLPGNDRGVQEPPDHDASRILFKAIMSLSARQRTVIVLRYGFGLTTSALAYFLDTTPQAVAMLHKRALEALGARDDVRDAMGVD